MVQPFRVTVRPDTGGETMARDQLITVTFALVCLAVAAIWWLGSGRALRPHVTWPTKAAASAPAPPAPATVAIGTGAFGVSAQQNLAHGINAANDRAAAAIQSAQ